MLEQIIARIEARTAKIKEERETIQELTKAVNADTARRLAKKGNTNDQAN